MPTGRMGEMIDRATGGIGTIGRFDRRKVIETYDEQMLGLMGFRQRQILSVNPAHKERDGKV
ncbi:hypothetical protein TomTYG75_31460 [Sphingobium sp. TomTYG75]